MAEAQAGVLLCVPVAVVPGFEACLDSAVPDSVMQQSFEVFGLTVVAVLAAVSAASAVAGARGLLAGSLRAGTKSHPRQCDAVVVA